MSGCDFNSGLLKIEKFTAKFGSQGKFLNATTGFFAKMIGRFEIDVIWRNIIFTGPLIVDSVNEFFSNVDTEFVVPAVIEPIGKFLGLVAVGKFRI